MKNIFISVLLISFVSFINPVKPYAQVSQTRDSALAMIKGEGWWGGIVLQGVNMPYGSKPFTFNLYGNDAGNQSVPLLISTKGRFIWSEQPFQFTFRNDSVIINKTYGPVFMGKVGNSLKDAYMYASQKYFPSSGKWIDSLLVTSPQYNLWIELMYVPTQKDVLNYAIQVLHNGMPAGVLMVDDNWSNYYGHFDFDVKKFPDAKALIDQLHRAGFKVMLWICPFITPDSEAYRELARKKLLLLDNQGNKNATWKDVNKPLIISWWNGQSACLDLSNPDAGKWLQSKLDYLRDTYGVDGYKLDAGDAAYYKNPNMVSFKTLLPNEHSLLWAEIGLHYPLNEYRAMWKMGGQPLVERLRDKSHTWEDLQTLVPNTIAQQLAGYTFTCPDMIGGGSFGSFLPGHKIDQKLIVRSAQVHAMMPMIQFSVAPWRILDSMHLSAIKKCVNVRQQYMPYIMSRRLVLVMESL
jgi:alpha-glucosidase